MLVIAIAIVSALLSGMPLAWAGHTGGRPEAFQPDLATGRFTSAIPIPVPPGRHGVQPTLALTYASGSSAALAGTGWTLEVGATERSTRFGVVTNTENQNVYVFTVGGVTQELVAIGGGQYRAKAESAFMKFTFNGTTLWEAWDRAGTYYRFDQCVSDPNGRLYACYLSKVQDVHGNTMTFTYWSDPDGWGKYLTQIDYTGHTSGLQPTNKVVLTWEPRPDIIYSLKEGLSNNPATFKITQRLAKVETFANNALVRRYQLTYTTSGSTGRSLLANVTVYGSDGVTALPTSTYTYSVPSGNYQTTTATTWASGFGSSDYTPLMGDLDRDGKTDLLTYNKPNGYWHYARSTGTGFATVTHFRTEKPNGTAFTGDFNGDGWMDLAVYDAGGNVDVALGTSAFTWGAFTRWLTGFGTTTSYSPIAADYNGDGKTDFATWEGINGYVHLGLSNGTAFAGPSHLLTVGASKYPVVGDFNGDGLTDIGTTDTAGNVDLSYGTGVGFFPPARWLTGFASWQSYTPIPFDANGDGLTDYATFGKSWGYWHWGTSKGNSFNWPGHYLTDFGTNQTPLVGDFNGDGMPDIGYFTTTGTWVICLRQGDRPDLMTSWANGLGGTVTATYASSATFDNTVNGTQAFGLAVPVLTAMTVNDGRGNSYTSTYSYSGGVFDYTTREFRGFAYAKATDPDGHYAETYFHQDEHKKGHPYKEQVYEKSAGATGPSEVLDQSQTTTAQPWFLGHDGGDNCWLAESFRLSGTGPQRVQQVELYVTPATYLNAYGVGSDPSGGFTVELQTDAGGVPSGTRVDPNALVLVNPPQRGAWNTVTFPVPLDLTAGTAYWLVMKYAGTVQWCTSYTLGANPAGGYAPGTGLRKYPGSSWLDLYGHDLAFKVYVTQPASQIPPKLLQQVDQTWGCLEPYPTTHFCYLASVTTSLYDGQLTPKQTKVDYTYDSYGNVLTQVESGELATTGDERTTTTDYAISTTAWILGVPAHTQIKEASGIVMRESWAYYDNTTSWSAAPTKGLLTKEEVWLSTAPSKPTTTHAYDACGNKTSTTDPLNRTTTTTYDTQKLFPIKVSNALGHTLQTTYQAGTGNILTTTDPNGQVTTTQYDALGRPTAVIGPLDTTQAPGVLYSYDLTVFPTKRVKQVRTTVGSSELYTSYEFYDGMDRLIQVKTPAEDATKQVVTGTQVLDTRGLVKEQYKPYLATSSTTFSTPDLTQPKVTYTYDPLGRATKVTSPDATFSTTAYAQWVVTLTDEQGKQKVRTQDAYGRLVKVEEKVSGQTYTTTYTYDALGNLKQTRDQAGNLTTITYDSLGRKTQMSDPDMGTWRYTYDTVGNLKTQTDAKSQQLSFTYDALNRLTQKITGPSLSVTYLYDDPVKPNGKGRLSKVTDNSGSTEFFYDLLGREMKTIKIISGTSYTIERTYDALNRVSTLKYPDGEVVTYTYNPQGIESVTGTVPGGGLSPYVSNLEYTATGQLAKQVVNGALMTTTYTYDPKTLRLATLKTANGANITLQDLAYAFDPAGNVATLTDRRRNQTQTFTYDDLHRLTQAQSPATYGTRTYGYDPIGNLTLKDGVTQTYAHATKPHAVTSRPDGLSMTYDANGNMLTKGTQALAYDAENRLIKVTSGKQTQATFTYDGDGGRVKKVTAAGTTTYVGKLYEKKPDGTVVKYIWLGSTRIASKSSTGTKLFYHANHLGSTDLVTDAAGTEVTHYEYTPWGEVFSSSGTVSVPHRYTGKELDPETGFYFYEARYYDPQLGRFLTPDTIIPVPSDPQSFNRYAYAHNNPLVYTDPTGHKGWNPFRSIARALGVIGRTVVSAVAAAVVFVAVTVATGGTGIQLAAAAAASTYAYTSTFLNASAQGASYGRALGAATVNGLAAFGAVYLGYGAGPLAGAAIGASFGAAGGAASSAILGGSPGTGALSGAVGGGIMGGVAGAFGPIGGLLAAPGAGAASAAVSGGNIGQGAYLGAIGAATFAIASASFQAALDAGRANGGVEADRGVTTYANRAQQPTESGIAQMMGETLDPLGAVRSPQSALNVNQGIGAVGRVIASMGLTGAARAVGAVNAGLSPGGDWAAVFGAGGGVLAFKVSFALGSAIGGPIVGGIAGVVGGGISAYWFGRIGAALDRPEAGYAFGDNVGGT